MPGSQCAVVIGTQLPTQKKLLVTGREDMLQVNSPAGSLSAWGPPSGIRGEGGLLPVSGDLLFHSVTAHWFGDFGKSPPFPALPEKL